MNIRNVAIIAHVDHGKTTLVDKILEYSNTIDSSNNQELVLDNNDLERERGITIVAKNVAIHYKDVKINVIDTPGHADFGGEVERVLNMADGVLLLVDAFEGVMPQTRYVLSKALALGKKPIVVVNKVDKENCRPEEVQEEVFDLMFNLNATEEQLDFVTIYGSAKQGWMGPDPENPTTDVGYLIDTIIDTIPQPEKTEGPSQMQITSIDFSSYLGRIAIGRVNRGTIKKSRAITLIKKDGKAVQGKIKELYTFAGMGKEKVEEVPVGDLCAFSGIENFEIGDTICDFEHPEALPRISIDEPTMSMLFTVNNSPFFGKEGDFVTSRHLRDRLYKECEKNLALRVHDTDSADSFDVYGRGIMHLSVLIETMRREGYELQVGKPRVIIKEIDGRKCEPMEQLIIDLPESSSGRIIELVTIKKGEMTKMEPKGDIMHLEFSIPSRGIIGLRTNVLNASAGEAIMTHRFVEFAPWKGVIPRRNKGSLIVHETGTTVPFALDKLKDRGKFFVPPGVAVYEGQVIGEHTRDSDLVVNVTKTKKMSNMRSSGADDKVKLAPPIDMSLEQFMEYIEEDEYVEVTPKGLRMRKIFLKEHDRKKASRS